MLILYMTDVNKYLLCRLPQLRIIKSSVEKRIMDRQAEYFFFFLLIVTCLIFREANVITIEI